MFPIQSSEFTKSQNFGSILKKKNCIKKSKNFNFWSKNYFLGITKYIFSIWCAVYSDRSELNHSDEIFIIQISISVDSFDEQ